MNNMVTPYPRGNHYSGYDRAPSKKQLGILKAGNLYISGKGMGWKSWKKRWFILTKTPTRTALVYFKGEPNGPINPSDALDGINLVNTGRVVAKLDKKMIILMFPDNRSYTFKADSLDELDRWRQMLEKALVDAPEPELETDQESYRSDLADSSRDFSGDPMPPKKRPLKSLVVGRPILLALEDIDGSPSFLEKALQFIETEGINVEGILRHSADVELVEKRVQAYEQGENEFKPTEDAHVIGDCIKHVLRELPSSPVPELCCAALIRAYRKPHRNLQVEEMRIAIADSFPEPNRRLLQRVLRMMLTVAAHSSVNLMNADAVARCMAPLLLRPIFSGEVPIFMENSDITPENGEEQAMLQAMNAANIGGALIRALMKEFDNIFTEDEHVTGAELSRSISHSGDAFPPNDSLPSHLYRDSDASTSGAPSDISNGVHPNISSNEERVRHDLSGVTLAREGEGGYTDADRGGSDALRGFSDGPPRDPDGSGERLHPIRGYSDTPQKHADIPDSVRGYLDAALTYSDASEEEELALIERLTQQRDALEAALQKRKEENRELKDGLRQKKQMLQDRRYDLEEEVKRLKAALVNEVDQHAMLEIGMGAASALLEHARDLDPDAQEQLQEIVALEKDITRLRAQADDLQIELQKRAGTGLSESDERMQRICDLSALQKQLEAELEAVQTKHAKEKAKNDEVAAIISAIDVSAKETALLKQQTVLADAHEKLRNEVSRTHLLRQRAGEQQQRRSNPPLQSYPAGGATYRVNLGGAPRPALTSPRSVSGEGNKPYAGLALNRLDSSAREYMRSQLEAAGVLGADGEDQPSRQSGDGNNFAMGPISPASAPASLGTPHQERRVQLMRQLKELSSPQGRLQDHTGFLQALGSVSSP